jgi:hypothetical protein
MGIFSSISDFFKSSNSLANTSHQQQMKNVEKSGIKVLEIQRKGTVTTVVEIPDELEKYTSYIVHTIISNYPTKFKALRGATNRDVLVFDSLIKGLAKVAEQALIWGFRDSKFYEELQGYDLTGTWVSTSISRDRLEINVHFRELCISSVISQKGIKRNVTILNSCPLSVLDNYSLPYEDVSNYYNLMSSHNKQLIGTCLTVIWKERYLEIDIDIDSTNHLHGKYYLYHPRLGLLTGVQHGYNFDSLIKRDDWVAIIERGVHFSSKDEAIHTIDSYIKPYLSSHKMVTGLSANASEVLVLSSGRAYSKYNEARFG